MTLTFEITDEALSALKDQLRISQLEYNIASGIGGNPATSAEHYARRILIARKVLNMSLQMNDVCHDLE